MRGILSGRVGPDWANAGASREQLGRPNLCFPIFYPSAVSRKSRFHDAWQADSIALVVA